MTSVNWPRTMPALITPFDDAGDIDIDAHRHNVGTMWEVGARGLLIAGSTGEGPYLETGERYRLVGAARKLHPNLAVLCGIAAETVRQAEAQIIEATDAGGDAVLVTTPGTLVRDRHKMVADFYGQVADASPIPVFLYTVPKVTGYILPTTSIRDLASHPNVVGMKDSGGDPARLADLRDVLNDGFITYVGSSGALLESAQGGAGGAITASANYAWDIVDRAINQDRDAQQKLNALTAVVEPHGVPGTKYAASLIGLRSGHSRSPLGRLAKDARASIAAVIASSDQRS